MLNLKQKQGFTLLEILLVVGLFAFLATVSLPVFTGLIERANLSSTLDLTQEALMRAQKYAQTQKNNSKWGVFIQEGQIVIFGGDAYNTRATALDEIIVIPTSITLTSTSDNQVVFEQISGQLSSTSVRFIFQTPTQNSQSISITPDGAIKRGDLVAQSSVQPSDITQLSVWLRGDSGISLGTGNSVVSWRSMDATAKLFSAPMSSEYPSRILGALNGMSGVAFDGLDDYLTNSSAFPTSQSFSMLVVAQVNNPNQNATLVGGNGSSNFALQFDPSKSNQRLQFKLAGQEPALISSKVTTSGEWAVYYVTYDHTQKKAELYENLQLKSSSNLNPATNPLDTDMQIGATGGGEHLQGVIAEVIVYNKLLSRSDRQALHQYIENRYNILIY